MVQTAKSLRIGLAQINSCVGDLERNVSKIVKTIGEARDKGVEIVCFPEMSIPGYPAEDLLLKPSFIRDNLDALEEIKSASKSITVIVGFIDRGEDIFNAAAVIQDGGGVECRTHRN